MANTLSIGILIHNNSGWLDCELVKLADQALSSHEEHRYYESVKESGTFLEGLLGQLMKQLEIKTPADTAPTLGALVKTITASKLVPQQLLDRLWDAIRIRNRATHITTHPLDKILEGDSLHILNIIGLVIEWYHEALNPHCKESPIAHMLPIFLSVGTPHRLDQHQFLQHLQAEMRNFGIELRRLSSAEYSKEKPFDQIHELMKSCRAALVVGLARSHAYTVFEREESEFEKLHHDQFIPTAWNQIEGSMASVLQLPILILRENSLYKEGVFEADNHRHHIRSFDIQVESKGISHELRLFLEGWVRHVREISMKA